MPRADLLTIGDVSAYRHGDPIRWGHSLMGDERFGALKALYTGDGAEAYEYVTWNPLRPVKREDVDWRTSSIPGSVGAR